MARKTTTPRRKPASSTRSKPARGKTSRQKPDGEKTASQTASGTSSASNAKPTRDKTRRKSTTSPWEWAAAAVGGAVFVALVGFLTYAGLTRPEEPNPDIVASAGPIARLGSGTFLVPLSVENLGHDTGANVTVRGSLRDVGGALIEESSTTFDYVAQHSTVEGGLFFVADPGAGTLTLRVEGYADP